MIIIAPLDREQQSAICIKEKQLSIPEFKKHLAKEYSTEDISFNPSNVLRYRIVAGQISIVIMDNKRSIIKVKETEDEQ